ncbi:MAG: aromatic ring-hydroxylating dioxygenase subunit alpha [Alphaproteobacteria bacterium]|nr:aromatic ring-hydroxylating dioxygenase subunit alpha [Alphaproteobacteria bacterium]
MSSDKPSFLRDIWYFAMPGAELKPGTLRHAVLLGEPVVFGRTREGEVFALRDLCPHRGVPLSRGRLLGKGDKAVGETVAAAEVECPYHGWRFRTDGRCAAIPSLVPGQDVETSRIRVPAYAVHESQGVVWIHFGSQTDRLGETPAPRSATPLLPGIGETARPRLIERKRFACHVDHAVIGLMDPAHGPFVHRSWWWRSEASIHEKAKRFGPSELGFTMLEHRPSKNSGAYKILGGTPTTEIAFRLPGIRTELVRIGEKCVLSLTAVTPIAEEETEVTQIFYWTLPWLDVARPVVRAFARAFLKQDHDMVMLQKEGLAFNPRLMLINDADVQAKWYFRLKKVWEEAREANEPFVNPVEPVTLRWRS